MSDSVLDIMSSSANLFSSGNAGGSAPAAVVEEGVAAAQQFGRQSRRRFDPVLYPGIDVINAQRSRLPVSFTTDSAMSKVDAGKTTAGLLRRMGFDVEIDAAQFGFIEACMLCMAANSASVLMPGRATFKVGTTTINFFNDVVNVLGKDARRYFRAYADETRGFLQDLQDDVRRGPKEDTEEALVLFNDRVDQWDAVMRVAHERGLSREPTLVHDSASHCTGLGSAERAFLTASKATLLSKMTFNSADNQLVRPASVPKHEVGAHTVDIDDQSFPYQ